MPLGLIARLRRHRRAVALAAAGLLAVQAFLAGLSMAQAALMLSPNLADADGFNIICHSNGGAGSDHGTGRTGREPASLLRGLRGGRPAGHVAGAGHRAAPGPLS